MRPAQRRLGVLLLLTLIFEACPIAVGTHGLRWLQLACTRLRGGAGAAQKAARAKRARLRQERTPPPKVRRSDQEKMRDHVLVVDKDSGERYFQLKTRSGVPVAVCLRQSACEQSCVSCRCAQGPADCRAVPQLIDDARLAAYRCV